MKRLACALAISLADVPAEAFSQGLPEPAGASPARLAHPAGVRQAAARGQGRRLVADALAGVKLQGFMMPLEMGDKQKHFVLTAMPQTCAFCLPGGPEALVEVYAKTPVKYTFEPLVLAGKLAMLKDEPNGIYHRLTEAVRTSAK